MTKYLYSVLLLVLGLHLSGCLFYRPSLFSMIPKQKSFEPNEGKSEVSVSYGLYSGTQMIENLNISTDDLQSSNLVYNTGNIFGTYRYYVSDAVSVGAAVGFQHYTYNWSNYSNLDYSQNATYATFAGELKWVTNDNEYFQFYHLFGFGTSYFTQHNYYPPGTGTAIADSKGLTWNMQFSPVCFTFGKSFGGYFELGLGYKGLLNTGLFYTFSPHRKADNR